MQPINFTFALTAKDANGVCQDQTTAGAADLVLNGQLAKDSGVARFGAAAAVRITCAGDETAVNFTIYGPDANGNPITEKVAGVSGTTTDTTNLFKGVIRVAVDGALAGNVEVGTAADDNSVCTSQTLAAAANLIINGVAQKVAYSSGVVELTAAQLVKIVCAGNETARTFTVYGRDGDGVEASEAITGVDTATATATTKLKTINRVTTDDATADAITVGLPGNLDAICESQTPGAAGDLIFDGEACTLVARHIEIEGTGDNSGVTFTVVGEDRNGDPLSEEITGANNGTATSSKNFRAVYTVRADGAVTGNVEIGTADSAESRVVPFDFYQAGNISITMHHSSDADFTHEFKYTNDMLLRGDRDEDSARYFENDGPNAATEQVATDAAITGVRFWITSFVAGSLDVAIICPRNN